MKQKIKIVFLITIAILLIFGSRHAYADYPATLSYSCPSGGTLSGTTCTVTSTYAATKTTSGGIAFTVPFRCNLNVYYPNTSSAFPICGYLAPTPFAGSFTVLSTSLGYLSTAPNCALNGPCVTRGYSSGTSISGLQWYGGSVSIPNTGIFFAAPSSGTYGATTSYSCPSGGTQSGTICTTTSTYAATPQYSCPSGGILSGTTCKTPINGSCGSSNGQTFSVAPSSNLCSSTGTTPTVTGSGPWNWICSGQYNGSDASCSANKICTPTIWTPSTNTVCSGTSFTQTSNCGTTQSAAGTMTGTWLPDANTVCLGTAFVQTDGCNTRSATGAKVCATTNKLTVKTTTNTTVISNDGLINCANGSGTCDYDYVTGTMVTLSGSAISPFVFNASSWTSGCDTISGKQCIVTLNSDKTVEASASCSPDPTCGGKASGLCTTDICTDICGHTYSGTNDCSGVSGGGWREVAP